MVEALRSQDSGSWLGALQLCLCSVRAKGADLGSPGPLRSDHHFLGAFVLWLLTQQRKRNKVLVRTKGSWEWSERTRCLTSAAQLCRTGRAVALRVVCAL